MTQDEIIEMVMQISGCDRPEYDSPALKMFEAFAKLVAAKEREDCARVCEEIRNKYSGLGDSAERVSVEWCLEAIRARGEQS